MMSERPFHERVYEVVKRIPHGRVTSYGAIARCIGSPGSSRMVGWAMNQSHINPDFIPAHRVVNRNGMLTGKHHFGGPKVMEELLAGEGVEVMNDRVVDFQKHFWEPAEEPGL